MHKTSVTIAVVLTILALLGFMAATPARALAAAAATQPVVGEKTRDFSLKTLKDEPVTLSGLLNDGPVVVVLLRGWVGYQCPVCTKQMASLMSHAKEVTDTGARVVLIYPGAADHLKAHAEDFVAGKSLPEKFFFVVDPDLAFVNDWGLRWDAPGENAYPATFVLDRDGKVLFKKVSHTHADRATAKEILQALGERK